jgi:hypothetical protein
VVYLIIMVVVAGVGIGRLWLMQRKHATTLQTVDGFRSSLERLSDQPVAPPRQSSTSQPSAASPPRSRSLRQSYAPAEFEPDDPSLAAYRQPLDPERRAAAKRRLEARRRGNLRRSDLRSR